MTTKIFRAALALPLVLALGCKDSTPSKAPQTQPPPTPSKVATFPQLEAPPSQSELDAKASKDINEKNADAEFEKLKNEIEGGGGK